MAFSSQLPKRKGFPVFIESWPSSLAVLGLLLVVQAPPCCHGQHSLDARLTSTEYSVTVTFDPNPAATNYSAAFRLENGPFITDFPLEPPYNGSELSQTYYNVLPGHVYMVEIYENGTTRDHRVFQQAIATVPLKPEDVTVVSRGNNFLYLQWISPQNLTYRGHELSYYRENGSLRVVTTSPDLSYNLTGLEAGYSYELYVTAVTLGVRSQPSQRVVAATIPLAPVNVAARAVDSTHINISWSGDPMSYQESYTVNYTLAESEIELSTLCVDTPCLFSPHARSGETISISVFAVSHSLTSQPASIKHSTAPGDVTELRWEADVHSVFLTWTPPLNSYQVFYLITLESALNQGIQEFRVDANLTSYTLRSLRGGHLYGLKIQAESEFELGKDNSRIVYTLPEPVSNLIGAAVNTTSIGFTWTNPTNSDFYGLNITIFTPDDETVQSVLEKDVTVTSYVVGGLFPGVGYTVNITVLSDYNNNQPSTEASALIHTKPVPPIIVDVVAGETVLNLTLALSSDIGLVDSIQAMLEGAVVQHIADVNGLVTFSNLEPGVAYSIKAFSVSGQVRSDEIIEILNTRPLPVTDLILESLGEDSINSQWGAPERGGFDNFTVLISDVEGVTIPKEILTSSLELTFENLQPGTTYNVSVLTVKGEQRSEALWDLNTTNPESVAALQKVESLTNSITVNWTAPTSVNIDFFQLGIQAVDPITRPLPAPVNVLKNWTSTTFQGLEPGLEYMIAIRTAKLTPGNNVQFGASVKLNAVTKPLPVLDLKAETLNTTAVSLSWETNSTSRQSRFRITYTADETSRSLTIPAGNESGQNFQLDIGQLLPGYGYSVSVVAIRSIETDLAESEEDTTLGYTVPSPVGNLTLTHDGSDLLVTWFPPASGMWRTYKVMYRPVLRNNETELLLRTSSHDVNNMRITDLFPGEMYEVKVTSTSNDLESEPREASTVFSPLPPTNFLRVKELTTTTGLTLTWGYNTELTYTERWNIRINAGMYRDSKVVQASEKQPDYSLALISLEPGETYSVSISATVQGQSSEVKTLEATTKPVINSVLTENPSTNSSVTLSYSIVQDDIFDHLLFTIHGEGHAPQVMKSKQDLKRSVTFDGLEAGTKYTVQAATVSKSETSDPKTLVLITDPNPVPVNFSSSSSSIALTLGPQTGQAAEYTVSCVFTVDSDNTARESCGERRLPANENVQEVKFDGLRPYQQYSFEVVTKAEMLRGEQKLVSREYDHMTDEAAPSAVRSLTAQARDIHTVVLTWRPPEMANGRLRSYHVAYLGSEPTDPQDIDFKSVNNISVTETTLTVENLQAGFDYKFSVSAVTVAPGEAAERTITLGTTAPAFRPGVSALTAKPALPDSGTGGVSAVTETKISLTFTNPFSSDNGKIRYYTVIVSEDPSAPSSSLKLASWADSQADTSIKVYQTLKQCEDFFSSSSSCGKAGGRRQRRAANSLESRTFIIGEESECQGKTFCNGPLRPDTDYYVKLRGFTASEQFQDTAYSEKIHTAKRSSSNAGMAAGIGSTVAVLVAVGVVVGVIIMRRRRRPKRATKHVGPKTNWEQSTMCKFSRPVKLSDFPAHVRKMAADSDFKYAEEYEDLKEVGRDQPSLAAEFPPNRPKNRFTNILPYDHSRVKLLPTDDDEGSDYINANYMPGFNSKREYIATQGPLPATRDDFWRMLWEQSTRNVVMLTRCQEKGREKSDHYWPTDSDPKFYGDLHVVILNETHMPDWTVTEIRVSLGDKSRNVRHFHYKVWPDFGVPKDPTSLIRFIRMVREKLVREGGPIITHCSAGVGRSGTFIVLDHLLQMIREKDEVDIFSIVYKLRKERVLMVQTELQYKFIHECLLCVLEGKEDDTTYANVGQINIGFDDDEGINVMEVP